MIRLEHCCFLCKYANTTTYNADYCRVWLERNEYNMGQDKQNVYPPNDKQITLYGRMACGGNDFELKDGLEEEA